MICSAWIVFCKERTYIHTLSHIHITHVDPPHVHSGDTRERSFRERCCERGRGRFEREVVPRARRGTERGHLEREVVLRYIYIYCFERERSFRRECTQFSEMLC